MTSQYAKHYQENEILAAIEAVERNNKTTNFKHQMVIQWSDDDHCFWVGFPDFSGQQWRTHGDTYELDVANGIEALESLVIACDSVGDRHTRSQDGSPCRLNRERGCG